MAELTAVSRRICCIVSTIEFCLIFVNLYLVPAGGKSSQGQVEPETATATAEQPRPPGLDRPGNSSSTKKLLFSCSFTFLILDPIITGLDTLVKARRMTCNSHVCSVNKAFATAIGAYRAFGVYVLGSFSFSPFPFFQVTCGISRIRFPFSQAEALSFLSLHLKQGPS